MTDSHTITEYVTEYVWPELVDGDQVADEPLRAEGDEIEHNVTPDEWDREDGRTAVDIATDLIRDAGAEEPSSSPEWQLRTWYTARYEHPYTGVIEERSFHLAGFSDDDARAVYAAIVKL
jgi:hypothetical protein